MKLYDGPKFFNTDTMVGIEPTKSYFDIKKTFESWIMS